MKKKKSNNVFINARDISYKDASKANAKNRL